MNEKILFALIFVAGVFISSVSQILLKKSAEKEYPGKIREYLNVRVIFAYIIFFGATLCSILAYKMAVLSRLFLKEKITKKKMLGLSVIIIGIVIYAL